MDMPKIISLHESRTLNVRYYHGKDIFAGELVLTPEKITLTLRGESTDGRDQPFGMEEIPKLECRTLSETFHLFDLFAVLDDQIILSTTEEARAYFTLVFEVGFAICRPNNTGEIKFLEINLASKDIGKWVGTTLKQENILKANKTANIESMIENMVESEFGFGDEVIISVTYRIEIFESISSFQERMSFEPIISIKHKRSFEQNELKNITEKLYFFICFLFGYELDIDCIPIQTNAHRDKSYLYFPTHKHKAKKSRKDIFIPLGYDLKSISESRPPLPSDLFQNFNNLPQPQSSFFEKFAIYKRQSDVTERFLGFFRMLETLTKVKGSYVSDEIAQQIVHSAKEILKSNGISIGKCKGLVSGLKHLNGMKYNTQKCIEQYYDTIPTEITTRWKIKRSEIEKICTLRNNITHANHYSIEDNDLYIYCKFIEVMLVLALTQLVKLPFEITMNRLNRISGYGALVQYSTPIVTIVDNRESN